MLQVVVDWGTELLFDPKAAQRIHELNPEFRLIVVIREPVQRLLAHHLVRKAAGLHPDSGAQLEDIIMHRDTRELVRTDRLPINNTILFIREHVQPMPFSCAKV